MAFRKIPTRSDCIEGYKDMAEACCLARLWIQWETLISKVRRN